LVIGFDISCLLNRAPLYAGSVLALMGAPRRYTGFRRANQALSALESPFRKGS
jgi:hypothetical protein